MPETRNTQTYDAVIIGAGVIGAAIGLELARAARRLLPSHPVVATTPPVTLGLDPRVHASTRTIPCERRGGLPGQVMVKDIADP